MTIGCRGRGTTGHAGAVVAAAAAVVLVVATSLAAMPAGAQVDPVDGTAQPARPSVYGGSASAFSYQAFVDTVPSAIIPDAVKPTGPLSTAAFDSAGRSDAKGSVFDPGRLGTDGLSLFCQFGFPCAEFPLPTYPLTAAASYPTVLDSTPDLDGTSFGDGGTSVMLGPAHAHADLDGADAAATTTKLLLGGALPTAAVLSIGSANAESATSFEGDVLVAHARSVLADVSIGAGLLRIDSIEASSTSRSSIAGVLENESHIEIGGARLAGQPVTIDEGGIRFAGTPLDGGLLGLLGQSLAGLLQVVDGTARLVGTSDQRDPASGVSADAVGLLVELQLDLSVLAQANPLGITGVRVGFLLGQASSSARTLGGLANDDGAAPVAPITPSQPGTVLVPGTPSTPGTPAIPAVVGGAAAALLRTTIVDRAIEGNGLVILYLVMTLSVAGCALSSRLRPFRLAVRR